MADMVSGSISFVPLREDDLPLLHAWLNTPHVSEWWVVSGNRNPSLEIVTAKYHPRIKNDEPVRCYVFYYENKPIGMIQSCSLDDFPEEKTAFSLEGKCTGIDLCIGDPDYVHRGLCSGIIRQFVEQHVFADKTVDFCTVDPDPRNIIAIKAYRKAGFRHIKTVWNEKDAIAAYLMDIGRDDII